MQKERKRKVSAGTRVVLAMTLVILAATAYVMIRLSSGAAVDLTQRLRYLQRNRCIQELQLCRRRRILLLNTSL